MSNNFYITLLLQNGLVMEAYTTLKKICFGQKILLQHFFKVCDDLGLLKEIFKFPITQEEEEEFMQYLDDCKSRDAGDLKIMYLLSRARYVEAIDVNHNLGTVVPKFGIVGNDTTKQNSNKGRSTTRDLLVNAFSRTLPGVTNELITFCRKEKDKIYRFKEVSKPTPLSVVVHTDTTQQIPTYKSSFESVLQAAISKTAETWTRFPKISDRISRNESIIKDTPFLRSDIMTPRKDKSALLHIREKTNFGDEKINPDEPPSKRLRRNNTDVSLENYCEMKGNDSLILPAVEVTKILRTPHVQKRLNKLLQNTPESSPLTSILKSSEISRFKQPQKVGFSVPEVNRKSPRKLADAQTNTTFTPKSNKANEIPIMKKSLVTVFDKSSKMRTNDSTKIDVSVRDDIASPLLDDSLNNSAAAESYYSLESDNESVPAEMLDLAVRNTGSSATKHFLESMSDEEISVDRKRIIMEVMSEEETVEDKLSACTEEIVIPPPEVPEENIIQRKSVLQQEETVTTPEQNIIMQEESNTIPQEESNTIPQEESNDSLQEQNVSLREVRYTGDAYLSQGVDEDKAVYSLDAAEDENPFFCNDSLEEVHDQLKPTETLSFAPLQPVSVPSADIEDESPVNDHPSWSSVYDEYNEQQDQYSSQFREDTRVRNDNQLVGNKEVGDEFLEITQPNLREDFSLEKCEKEAAISETVNETADKIYETDPALEHSVTEIKDSSSDEDSDIEIVEDHTTSSATAKPDDQMNDATTEENDDMSEKTYESDYSYSQESADGESCAEENESLANDDENVEELDEIEEEYEDEDELEETEVEEREDIEDAEAEVVEEADVEDMEEAQVKERDEEKKTEKEESDESDDYEQELLYQDHPMINYDELRKIVSNVAAAESKASETEGPKPAASLKSEGPESASLDYNEEASVCEVYDMTQSVIEETIHMDYLDTSKVDDSANGISMNEKSTSQLAEVFDVESEDDIRGEKYVSANESQQENTSVEVLSLSSVDAGKTLEGPPMVFYFGENSVASIAEELLSDEPQELGVSKEEMDKGQSVVEDGCSMKAEKCESIDEDQESFRENDESSSSGNVASEKHEGFEVESSGCLTATHPECNIHYIEKIDIEDSRQFERFGKNQYSGREEVSRDREEESVEYMQLGSGVESDQRSKNESVIIVADEKRRVTEGDEPEDLSQHDIVARERTYDEAREASRLGDVSSRDGSIIVSAEDCYKVDSMSKNSISSKSLFASGPDTSPLDLVMAANAAMEIEGVSSDVVVRSPQKISTSPSKTSLLMADTTFSGDIHPNVKSTTCLVNTVAEIEVKSCDSSIVDNKSTTSPKKNSISPARSTKLLTATADTTYSMDLRSVAVDVTYTIDSQQPAKDATYVIDSQNSSKDTTYTIDLQQCSKDATYTITSLQGEENASSLIGEQPFVKESSSPASQVLRPSTPKSIIEDHSSKYESTSSSVKEITFSQPFSPGIHDATLSVSMVSQSASETDPVTDKTITSEINRNTPLLLVVEASMKSSSPIEASSKTPEKNVDKCSVQISSSEKTIVHDIASQPTHSISQTVSIDQEPEHPSSQPLGFVVSDLVVNSPRRSLRIACRRSIDSIPDALDDDAFLKSTTSPKPLSRRRSLTKEFEHQKENIDDDDAMSIKSGSSVAESIASHASTVSNQSQKRKRSFSRFEMRKSSVKRQFKTLEVIVSDEEMTSPTKSEIISSHPRRRTSRNYAASEPGDQTTCSRALMKRSRMETDFDDDETLSTVSDVGTKPRRNVRKKSELKMLNEAMLKTPSPIKSRMKKLVSSTPMTVSQEVIKPSTASTDYTSSRRLTRFQKTLLEYGIKRVEKSERASSEPAFVPRVLQDVSEENESFDSEKDFPEGSLVIDEDNAKTEPLVLSAGNLRLIDAKQPKKNATRSASTLSSSLNSSKQVSVADASSDESFSSKTSGSTRRSQSRPSTYSTMELRRSSVRRQFKPLVVIPSDEESSSFQTPQKVLRLTTEEESIVSSPKSSKSKTRSVTRSKKNESDISDRESTSDVSISSSATARRTRRSLAGEMSAQTRNEKPPSEANISAKQYATNRRLTRNQKTMMEEKTLKKTSKKK